MPLLCMFRHDRARASRRRRLDARPAIECLEVLSLLSGGTINAAWFARNLKDPAIESLAKQDWAQSGRSLTRDDMIGIFEEVAAAGPITTTELADLKTLVKNAVGLKMPSSVYVLSNKTVNDNVANETYQDEPLLPAGKLVVGTTGSQLTKLVDKWFLGDDVPDLGYLGTVEGGTVSYANVSGSLYGPGGIPLDTDIAQGDIADCYFLSSLGIVAERAPQRIQAMINPNGDGTYTVRFIDGKTADYVTVNSMLPVDSNGMFVAAGYGSFASTSTNVLWPSLIEKAYAQLAGEGWSRAYDGKTANSYDSLNYGQDIPSLAQIAGLSAKDVVLVPTTDVKASMKQENLLSTQLLDNHIVLADTPDDQKLRHGVIQNHVYMATGYDATTQKINVTNPYDDGDTYPPDGKRFDTFSYQSFVNNFVDFVYVPKMPPGTSLPGVMKAFEPDGRL